MPPRRKEVELSVERTVGSPLDPRGEVVRLSARFDVPPGSDGPSPQELEEVLQNLRDQLDRLPGVSSGADRTLEELIQAYRPRQAELVDLLRAEGEITAGEHELLRTYVAKHATERGEPVAPPTAAAARPAPPSATARGPGAGRSKRSSRSIASSRFGKRASFGPDARSLLTSTWPSSGTSSRA